MAIPRIFEGLPARYAGPNPSTRPDPPREFKPPAERAAGADRACSRKRFDDAEAELAKIPLNGVRVNAVEVGGPYSYDEGPVAREPARRSTPAATSTASTSRTCAPRIMTDLARRAFRRPVTAARGREVRRARAQTAQKEEGSFDEGLAVGIQALLVSPDFLFRIERDRPVTAPALGDLAPDHAARARDAAVVLPVGEHARRRAAARRRRRHAARSGVLACQVRRMLRDPKVAARSPRTSAASGCSSARSNRSRAIATSFPDFEDYLRLSMRRETELFVEHIVREDRSILDFIDGRYSFLNERLARHYGMPNVVGPEFRRSI